MADMIPFDLHVHPDYSIDAKSSIEQYCMKTGQIGLKVIGFTTHYDINPDRSDVDPFMIVDGEKVRVDDYALGRYFDDCFEAQRQFPDLKILIGLEVDYFIGVEAAVARLKSEFPFDYLIGSVHCLEAIAISSKNEASHYFNSHSLEQMADSYYELLFNLANCGLFDVIGHADYYRRYGSLHYGEEINNAYKGRFERIIKAAARTKTGFELNTSQSMFRHDDFYPHIDFVKEAVEMGAVINAIGSDTHHVDSLGANINSTLELISSYNIPVRPFYESK